MSLICHVQLVIFDFIILKIQDENIRTDISVVKVSLILVFVDKESVIAYFRYFHERDKKQTYWINSRGIQPFTYLWTSF